jgi:glycogen debranching enzyme
VRRVFEANRVVGTDYRYTRPAQLTYPHQWLWDSCFHAIVLHVLGEHEAARDELRALFREQVRTGPDRGRLPHMTFMGASPAEAVQDPDGAAAYARDLALWRRPRSSTITQQSVLADAILRVGDQSFWSEMYEPLCAYYDWWIRRRDPNHDGLYAAWHLWETAMDATPRGDPACARLLEGGRTSRALDLVTVNPTAKKDGSLLNARLLMLEKLRDIDDLELRGDLTEHDAQSRRTALLGLASIDLQALLVKSFFDLEELARRVGRPPGRYSRAGLDLIGTVNDQLWDDDAGFYFDRWGERDQPVRVLTVAAFVALYAPGLVPSDRAERLLTHLLDPDRFWTRWPLPTVSRHEKTFDPDEYTRGPMLVQFNWIVVQGLIRAAQQFGDSRFLSAARAISERTVELVARLGLREFYRSGAADAALDASVRPAGFGPNGFAMSGLALDLAQLSDTDLAGA